MELQLHKRHVKGASTYINPATRAKVTVSRKMFAGDPPETLVFDAPNIAAQTEKDKKRAERAAKKAAKMENLPDRIAKSEAAIERRTKKLAQMRAALEQQQTTGTQASA